MIPSITYIGVLRSTGCITFLSFRGNMSKMVIPCILGSKSLSTGGNTSDQDSPPKKPISKAMKAYLQRAQDYENFIKKEQLEYKLGKRHLANMMGEDPELFTQDDVDRAIEYLFPSGLFEPRARPQMKPPEEVFPPQKAAQFDEAGRPFSSFFYTGRPNFYKLLHDTVAQLSELNDFEDKMIKKYLTPDPTKALDLNGSEWLPQDLLEHRLVEKLHETDYTAFLAVFNRLASHPYSYCASDFIMKYRKTLQRQTDTKLVPEPTYDADGRAFVTTSICQRKDSIAEVTVWGAGSGKISINGTDLSYFEHIQEREQVIFPLIFTGFLGVADVLARVSGGGPTGQAGAVRWGIATGLCSFVDQDMQERMRIAGLLTKDRRTRERKKPGQEGARKKFTWKKR